MPVTKLPFHADHIGSLLRPTYVAEAQEKANKGEISSDELQRTREKAIKDIVGKQLSNNVRAISSGEFERQYYFSGFFENLQGFRAIQDVPWDITRLNAPPIKALQKAGKKYPMVVVCEGKIKYINSPYLNDWKYLRSCVPESQAAGLLLPSALSPRKMLPQASLRQ